MDRTTRCQKCGKCMVSVVTISGRTELQCISCDDPAVKWAQSPLTVPDEPTASRHRRALSKQLRRIRRCASKSVLGAPVELKLSERLAIEGVALRSIASG